MKIIILTQIELEDEQKELLKNCEIIKIALNNHAEELKPDYRIASDYGLPVRLVKNYPQKVIALRDWVQHERLIYGEHIPFYGSTIVGAIDFLISKKYDEILIVADNTIHSDNFQNDVKKEMSKVIELHPEIKIFQFSKGNFDLETKSIKDFIEGR